MSDDTFTKILRSNYSPQNGCFVSDGEVLTLIPPKAEPSEETPYWFVSTSDLKTRSQYGWVDETDPFTLESFVARYPQHTGWDNVQTTRHALTMLSAIRHLPISTPVAVGYVLRVFPVKTLDLSVHKVVFV